jgi:hypothetical protein
MGERVMSDSSRNFALLGLGMGAATIWGSVRYYLPTVASTIESTLSSGAQSAEEAALLAEAQFQEMYQQAWEASASGLPTVEISPEGVISAAIEGAAQFVQPQTLNTAVAQSQLQCFTNETMPGVSHLFQAPSPSPSELIQSFELFVQETCPSNQTAVSLVNSAHEMLNQAISGPGMGAVPEQFVTTLVNFVNQTAVPGNTSSQLICENLLNYTNATLPNSEVAKGAMGLLQSISLPPVVPSVAPVLSEPVIPAMPTVGKYLYGGFNLYQGYGALKNVYDLIVNNRTLAQAGKTALSLMNVPMLMDQVLDPVAKAFAGEDKPEEQAMFKQYIQMGLFAIQSAVLIGTVVMTRKQRNAAKEQEQLGLQYMSALAEAIKINIDPSTVKKPEKLNQKTADELLKNAQEALKRKLEAEAVLKAAVITPVALEQKQTVVSEHVREQINRARDFVGEAVPKSATPVTFSSGAAAAAGTPIVKGAVQPQQKKDPDVLSQKEREDLLKKVHQKQGRRGNN